MINIVTISRSPKYNVYTKWLTKGLVSRNTKPFKLFILTDQEFELDLDLGDNQVEFKLITNPEHLHNNRLLILDYLDYIPELKDQYVYFMDSDCLIYDALPDLGQDSEDICVTYLKGAEVEDNEYMFTKIPELINRFSGIDPSFNEKLKDLLVFNFGVYGFHFDNKMENIFKEAKELFLPNDPFITHPLTNRPYSSGELFMIYVISKHQNDLKIKYMNYHQIDFKKRRVKNPIIYHYVRTKYNNDLLLDLYNSFDEGKPFEIRRKLINSRFWESVGVSDFKGHRVLT